MHYKNRILRLLALLASLMVLFPSGIAGQNLYLQATEANKPFEPMVRTVLEKAGYTLKVEYAPLARIVEGIKDASVDGVFLIGDDNIKSAGALKVPVVLASNDVIALTVKPGIVIKSLDDLKTLRIGILRGNKSQSDLTKGMKVDETDSYETSIKMLVAGRFDVALTSRLLAGGLIKQFQLKSWVIHEPPLAQYPLFLALAPHQKNQVDRMARAFQASIDSGEWGKKMTQLFKDMLN